MRVGLKEAILSFLVSAAFCRGADILDNAAIVKLTEAGLGQEVIVSMIAAQPGSYTTSTEAIIDLKGKGVAEEVLGAMIRKQVTNPIPDVAPINHTTPPIKRSVADVRSIFVEELGRGEGSDTIRAKLINEIASTGIWKLANKADEADAFLRGSGTIAQQYSTSDGRGGTYFTASLTLRLVNSNNETLWACDLRPHVPAWSLLPVPLGIGRRQSASSNVVEQAVKKLVQARAIPALGDPIKVRQVAPK